MSDSTVASAAQSAISGSSSPRSLLGTARECRLRGAATTLDDVAAAPGLKALAEARRLVGVTEDPPGSNRTQFGRWFGADGEPWCAMFLSYCFKVGAGIALCGGFDGAGVAA